MTTRLWPPTPAGLAQAFLVLWLMSVPFSTAVAEVLLGLAVAAALAARFVARPEKGCWDDGWSSLLRGGPTTRPVPWLVLLLLILFLVSVSTAVDPATSAGKIHKLFRYALFFTLLAVPWSETAWHWAWRLLVPATLALVWFSYDALDFGYSRAKTPNLHYNTLSQVAALISLLLLAAALYGPHARRRERWVYLAFCLVASGVLAVTLSRAAWAGWLSGVVLLLVFRLPKRLMVALLVLMVVAPLLLFSTVLQRRSDLLDVQHPEFTRRYDMWDMAGAIIADHPWTGIGPGGMGAVYDHYKTGALVDDPQTWPHVHNDVLEVALSHGIPAALVWVVMMIWLYVALVRRMTRFRRLPASWTKAGFAGAGVSLHLFYLCGLVHDNYAIYLKICLLLFLWGQFVSTDRRLGPIDPLTADRVSDTATGVAA
jgi:O-antigen ligase